VDGDDAAGSLRLSSNHVEKRNTVYPMMLVGRTAMGKGRDSFALLRSNNICLGRRPVWRVDVEYMLALLAVSLVRN
jgi:hypothetical protein